MPSWCGSPRGPNADAMPALDRPDERRAVGGQLGRDRPILARARRRDDVDGQLPRRARDDDQLSDLDAIRLVDPVHARELAVVDAVRLADAIEVLTGLHAM